MKQSCPLCTAENERILWQDDRSRVILVEGEDYPGYCRVIWRQHLAEMTDLSEEERNYLMGIVFAVESLLRQQLGAEKINLAALGNQVPHLHWHVIPRFSDDPTFPDAIWAPPRRTTVHNQIIDPDMLANALKEQLTLR